MTIQANPQETYALVVGIEKYAYSPKANLDGPARDAVAFVKWLLQKDVPANNIYLHLSPLDDNKVVVDRLGLPVKPAEHDPIVTTINDNLAKQTGQLLFIFWEGHGDITLKNQRRLLYANANLKNMLNLELDSLLAKLRSDHFNGLRQQVCFVDACANRVNETPTYPLGQLTHGNVSTTGEAKQFVFLSARPGNKAKNLTTEQTGLFSKHLLTRLEERGWLPDFPELAARLQRQFNNLRAEGKTKQAPVYYHYTDWTGNQWTNKVTMAESSVPVPTDEPVVQPIGVGRTLTFKQRKGVIQALMRYEVLQDYNRRKEVISQLSQPIMLTLTHSPIAIDHVSAIVKKSAEHPNGLENLIEVVTLYMQNPAQAEQLLQTIKTIIPDFEVER